MFSYAGQRIGMMAISDHLFNRSYPDLLRYYSSDKFGHSVIFGALYGLSAGVSSQCTVWTCGPAEGSKRWYLQITATT